MSVHGLGGVEADLRRLEARRDEEDRFVDLAVRFEVYRRGTDGMAESTGIFTDVYGGRWDRWSRCYNGSPGRIVTLKSTEDQVAAITDDAPKLEISAGRGRGKSEGAVLRMLRFLLERPSESGRVISPTSDLTDVVRAKLLASLRPEWIARVIEKPYRSITLINGALVQFRSAVRPDSLRSWGGSWTLVDEAQDVTSYAIDIAWPCLRETPRPRMWFTLTPKTGEALQRHDAFESSPDANCLYFTDNCFVGAGSESVYAVAERDAAAGGMSKDTYNIEYGANWDVVRKLAEDKSLKPVFYMFDPYDRHKWRPTEADFGLDITRETVEGSYRAPKIYRWKYIAGVDPNGARPNAAIIYKCYAVTRDAIDPHHNGRTIQKRIKGLIRWVASDVVQLKGHCGHLAAELKIRGYNPRDTFIVLDASGRYNKLNFKKTSAQLLRDAGYIVHTPRQNPRVRRSIEDVIAKLDPVSGIPLWYIRVPECDALASEMSRVLYDKSGNDFDKTVEPDLVDAMRYPVSYFDPASHLPRKVEAIVA